MILEIRQYGDPVLRKKCRKVEEIDDEVRELAENMVETMVDAQGVGLAAPQIGEDLRLAVVDVSHDPECISFLRVDGQETPLDEVMPLIFVNPDIEFGPDKESDLEGCLSIEGVRAEVKRPAEIKVQMTLIDGREITLESDGLLARAIQHEVDHLNGVLFIDRLNAASKLSLKRRLKRLQARTD
ncbi:MAG: peptide deformylase [Verrucomicrobiota bacterium JB023]|nr:peptide deformylase [Verrucomicrobiota bacterium JB023]